MKRRGNGEREVYQYVVLRTVVLLDNTSLRFRFVWPLSCVGVDACGGGRNHVFVERLCFDRFVPSEMTEGLRKIASKSDRSS